MIGARLFSLVPSKWTGDKGHDLKYRKFPLNRRGILFILFFNCQGGQTLEQVVEFPSLEIIKTQLDTGLRNPLRLLRLWAEGWIRQSPEASSSLNHPYDVWFYHKLEKEASRPWGYSSPVKPPRAAASPSAASQSFMVFSSSSFWDFAVECLK